QPLLEAEPDQVAAGKPEQSRRADTHGHQPAARMTADPADGEDRAPLVHPAEMPPPSWPPVESGKSEEDIDLTSRDPPDRLGIIQRQRAVGYRFFADTEGQQFLDQEPGQIQLGRGGSRRQSIRR